MRNESSFAFTDNQQAVIESQATPVFCMAGAGTGKTEILVQKEIGILKDSVQIDEIFTITFTNKAADEMRRRLHDRLYSAWLSAAQTGHIEQAKQLRRLVEISGTLQVSTIHGFCERLLREFGPLIGLSTEFRIDSFYDENQEIIESVVKNAELPAVITATPQHKLASLVSDILNKCSDRGIVLSDEYLKKRKRDKWHTVKAFILELCMQARNEIEAAKLAENILTLNDLMSATLRLLHNEYALAKITAQCKVLYCDEYQDTDAVQFQIVQALMNAGVRIFLIGDDQQSIYSYRGADINASRRAHEIINAIQPSKQTLNENFRSDPAILSTVNGLFSKKFSYAGKPLRFPFFALLAPENAPAKRYVENPYRIVVGERTSQIIKRIIELDKIGDRPLSYSDIFVLCRTNRQVAAAENELRTAGLPVAAVGGKGFYRKKEIVDVYKLFCAILKSGTVYTHELAFTDYYAAVRYKDDCTVEEFLAELNFVFREESIDGILEYIYEKSGILAYYDFIGNYQAVANLNKLRNIAGDILSREFMQPLGFTEHLSRKIESSAEEDEAEIDDADRKKGIITVMTIHKAKGLSLPVVIVPNIERALVEPKTFPDFIIDPEKKRLAFNDIFALGSDAEYDKMLGAHIAANLEEELRVLYVAMTRAESLLVMATRQERQELAEKSSKEDYVSWYKWIA